MREKPEIVMIGGLAVVNRTGAPIDVQEIIDALNGDQASGRKLVKRREGVRD